MTKKKYIAYSLSWLSFPENIASLNCSWLVCGKNDQRRCAIILLKSILIHLYIFLHLVTSTQEYFNSPNSIRIPFCFVSF